LSGVGGGPLKDLGTLGGTTSAGSAVNAFGQVAGSSFTASGAQHAFLSGADGGPLKDLGILPGGTFSQGFAVNDSGQVVGYGDTTNVPEPSGLVLLGTGAIGLLGYWAWRRTRPRA
jgi:probable HAF family extracellular repeat protein